MKRPETNVAVFSGGVAPNAQHIEQAEQVGVSLAKNGFGVVNGGGPGLMEHVAKNAFIAGGYVTGIHFEFEGREKSRYNTETISFSVLGLGERQKKILELADLFLVLPGGLGTLYETIEAISFRYVGSLPESKKIILLNKEYWSRLDEILDFLISEKYAKPGIKELYQIVDSVEEAIFLIKTYAKKE